MLSKKKDLVGDSMRVTKTELKKIYRKELKMNMEKLAKDKPTMSEKAIRYVASKLTYQAIGEWLRNP